MTIAISGLTAAGKTTHTGLLAEAFALQPVHFTDLLLEALGVESADGGDLWFRRLQEIESLRDHGTADDMADAALAQIVRDNDDLVVDSMLLPWTAPPGVLRIWIGSDRVSRAWKCIVSALGARTVTTVDAITLIDRKDGLTRARFRDRGVDFYADRDAFDFVLDNSHLIAAPTRDASECGIRRFHDVLVACVLAGVDGDYAPLRGIMRDDADPSLRACVVSVPPAVAGELPADAQPSAGHAVVPSRRL